MIVSMTGYGRVVRQAKNCFITVEARSVNSKYCEASIHLPKIFACLEVPLKTLVQEKLVRGKADVHITAAFQKAPQTPVLNRSQFVSCLHILEQMKTLGGLSDALSLEHIMKFSDIIDYEQNADLSESEKQVQEAVLDCLMELITLRKNEGARLKVAVLEFLAKLEECTAAIDKEKEGIFDYWLSRFKTRMKDFTLPDDSRLIQEAAIFAEKADISEEITRINSHIGQFKETMEEFPCGKKLDFLCQELNREFNTVSSKSSKLQIINKVVEAKSALESIKEQLQNIV